MCVLILLSSNKPRGSNSGIVLFCVCVVASNNSSLLSGDVGRDSFTTTTTTTLLRRKNFNSKWVRIEWLLKAASFKAKVHESKKGLKLSLLLFNVNFVVVLPF